MPCALDFTRKFTLAARAVTCLATWLDLARFSGEAAQRINIFIVEAFARGAVVGITSTTTATVKSATATSPSTPATAIIIIIDVHIIIVEVGAVVSIAHQGILLSLRPFAQAIITQLKGVVAALVVGVVHIMLVVVVLATITKQNHFVGHQFGAEVLLTSFVFPAACL